jgi:hypothetical protein
VLLVEVHLARIQFDVCFDGGSHFDQLELMLMLRHLSISLRAYAYARIEWQVGLLFVSKVHIGLPCT